MIIVLMGVSGSGKTTTGLELARSLGCPFYDADDFHPASNREKMTRGIPLTDEDRGPWLETLAARMPDWEGNGPVTVLACSALKEKYRDLLSSAAPVKWVHLKGDRETLLKRLQSRKGHFAGPGLLDSQLEALEEPEDALVVDIRQDPRTIVKRILQDLKEGNHGAE